MIEDQNQARVKNRYRDLKQRAEASDLVMKHLGTKSSEGENTDIYFENFELTSSPWKTVFYNIFTLAFDVFLYLAVIAYFWTIETAMWSIVLTLSGASAVFLYLSFNKVIDIIIVAKIIRKNKSLSKRNGYLDSLMKDEDA